MAKTTEKAKFKPSRRLGDAIKKIQKKKFASRDEVIEFAEELRDVAVQETEGERNHAEFAKFIKVAHDLVGRTITKGFGDRKMHIVVTSVEVTRDTARIDGFAIGQLLPFNTTLGILPVKRWVLSENKLSFDKKLLYWDNYRCHIDTPESFSDINDTLSKLGQAFFGKADQSPVITPKKTKFPYGV